MSNRLALVAVLTATAAALAGCETSDDDTALAAEKSDLVAALPQCGTLRPGERLVRGQELVSCNGRHVLAMQRDGNLVVYSDGTPRWHTFAFGAGGDSAVMQGDGNFVLYRAGGGAPWHSDTWSFSGATATLQDDGNFVIYYRGAALWSTWTGRLMKYRAGESFDASWVERWYLSGVVHGPFDWWAQRIASLGEFRDTAGAGNLCWGNRQPRILTSVVTGSVTSPNFYSGSVFHRGRVVCDP